MLPAADLYSALVFARNQGILGVLSRLYAELPPAVTPSPDFCRSPAPAALVEYLNAYRQLKNLPDKQAKVLKATAEFYFLELVDPEQVCPFFEGECLLGPARPLFCRALGLLSREEFAKWEEDRVQGLKAVAEHFKKEWDLEIPAAILLPRPYPNGAEEGQLTLLDLEGYRLQLMELDARIASPDLAYHRFTFLPLATHLAMTVFNPGIRGKRAEVMRAYLAGSRELLDKYVERAQRFKF
ncbi:hypothetical protein Adeg_0216 [Ammonifex degensii KC4]|uniref:Uncharacterized protein n=1 Tax=Ammonifex degensii (strain DSM 10501 / KC4) TaxID=429009 RepID=C9RAW0_AMMDK|nr:hypothetical protein [Ammonifex degensii]ACX51387.1 hypothetical protein Adeg_0216 [Ammonifex degensii KC4]